MNSPLITRRAALAIAASATTAVAFPSLASAQEAGVLRVASPWEWTSNEPTDTGYIMARMQIAETLVMVEPDGKLVGGIAESWTVSEDKLSWRFKIRSGAVFHDGTPVTAEAAAARWNWTGEPACLAFARSIIVSHRSIASTRQPS